jgi:2-phosphosulfolactate phosphatase
VAAGCLRNAASVADWAASQGGSVAVIAAGEQWADGSLRPAAEDLIAAGSIISGLPGTRSPEAKVALAAYQTNQGKLRTALSQSVSGQDLIAKGFAEDIDYAAELNVSSVTPRLQDGAFV